MVQSMETADIAIISYKPLSGLNFASKENSMTVTCFGVYKPLVILQYSAYVSIVYT